MCGSVMDGSSGLSVGGFRVRALGFWGFGVRVEGFGVLGLGFRVQT